MERLTSPIRGALYVAASGPIGVEVLLRSLRHGFVAALAIALVAAFGHLRLSARAAQQNYRLNDLNHLVDIAVLSPDERTVLYTAWYEGDGQENLYTVPLDGSRPPLRLNQVSEYGAFAYMPQLSPDGSQAFYLFYTPGTGQADLYTVSADGSAPPVRLNVPLPTGSYGVGPYLITPDGSRVVYIAQQDSPGADELYSVPADGSAPPTRLSGPLVAGGNVLEFLITPDGSRVLFLADYRFDDVFELASALIDGSAPPMRLSPTLVSGGDVRQNFQIAASGGYAVFRADALVDDVFELISVPVDSSAPPVHLNAPLVPGGEVHDRFLISPDSSRVIFYGDLQADGVDELASAPVDGSEPLTLLNQPLVASGNVHRNFVVTPDSAHVLFVADAAEDERHELFRVPIDGSAAPISLSGLPASGAVYPYAVISPDGARVAYRVVHENDDPHRLFTVAVDGSAPPVELSQPLDPGGKISLALNFSSDGKWLVYAAALAGGEPYELYLAPAYGNAAGIAPLKINGPLVDGGYVSILDEITVGIIVAEPYQGAQSQRILYQAIQDLDDAVGLYVTHITPPAVRFESAADAVPEASGVVTATVRLDGPAQIPITVEIAATGGEATEGVDYELFVASLTFAPGETAAPLALIVLDDDELEDDESVELTLLNPQQATLGAPTAFTLTIVDDEEEEDGGEKEDDPPQYSIYGPFFIR